MLGSGYVAFGRDRRIRDSETISFLYGRGGNLSPITNVQMPPNGVLEFLFGLDESIIPELVLSPFAEEGYYIFLKPLSPGQHTIHFAADGCSEGFSQNVTYYLTVTED